METVTAVCASIAVVISAWVFYRQSRLQRHVETRAYNEAWQLYNQTALQDEQLLSIERELHPYSNMTTGDTRRMFLYFMRFNVIYGVFSGSGEIHRPLATSAFRNEANVSYSDREFIRKHVFPRGYDVSFTEALEELWKKIEKSKKLLPMLRSSEE